MSSISEATHNGQHAQSRPEAATRRGDARTRHSLIESSDGGTSLLVAQELKQSRSHFAHTRFYPTILRIVMFIGEANWPVCTENVKGISCLESTTRVLPGQS